MLPAMSLTGVRVTVDAASIPFRVLGLIGKDRAALRKLGARWTPVASPREPGGLLERWAWAARGTADGEPITLAVLVRLYEGVVWAIGVHAASFLFQLEHGDGERPYLVTVDRPADTPATLVNWISKRDGELYDVGLAE